MPTANTFKVTIYTPEQLFGTFEAVSLTCNATDGEICVMRDHMPMLLAIISSYYGTRINGALASTRIVGVLMGDADDSGETYYCAPSAYSDYDDFYF